MMQSKPWNPPSVLYIVWTEENIKWECIFNLFCSHFSTLSKCHWQAGQNLVNCKNKIIKISSIIYRKIHVCQGINSYISDTKRYTINATSKGEREPSNIKFEVGKILVSVCLHENGCHIGFPNDFSDDFSSTSPIENWVLFYFMSKCWGNSTVHRCIPLQQGSIHCSWPAQASFPWLLCPSKLISTSNPSLT